MVSKREYDQLFPDIEFLVLVFYKIEKIVRY